MAITAALVKELRERTGAGMMDCKKALQATDGDIEKAIEDMRKAGQAKADKKADRVAAEGVIIAKTNEARAVMLEVNSETDFVARDDNFKTFVERVASIALEEGLDSIDAINQANYAEGQSVEEARQALVAKIGENIQLRRIQVINTSNTLGAYIHGARMGVLVELQGGDEALAKDIAMHIAASNPAAISEDDVDPALIEKERDIFTAQARESGKPDDIIEKMIGGRVQKFLKEVTLLGQPFVKNPDMTVAQLVKDNKATVVRFERFVVGEGIEKKEDNFVEEVMAQVR